MSSVFSSERGAGRGVPAAYSANVPARALPALFLVTVRCRWGGLIALRAALQGRALGRAPGKRRVAVVRLVQSGVFE